MSTLSADLRRVLDCTFPLEDPDELAAVLPIIKAACPRPEYLPRAELHKCTHGVDLLPCPCGVRRRVVAIVSDRDRVGELFERLGAKIHASPGPIPIGVINYPVPALNSIDCQTAMVMDPAKS